MRKLNVDNFDLNLLAVFLRLWETRSVTRASDRLALTQPAVSHALRRLRDALGDELFVQSRNGLVPTSRAQTLIGPVTDALAKLGVALQESEPFAPALARREFAIGCGDLVEFSIAPQLLEAIRREAPGILIRLVPVPDAEQGQPLLESGEIDAVIDAQAIRSSGVCSEAVAEVNVATLIWKREKLGKRRFPLELFLDRPHVVIRTADRRGTVVDQMLAQRGLQRSIGAVVQHFLAMPIIAARTGFICNLPRRMGTTFAELFELSVHEPPLPFASTTAFLSWHRRFDADPGLAWLLQQIRHAAAD
ncbi:LysR family transcriptional regulator [Lysobacter sp. TAF61]|uniref:LysR family transcriptional regulator n=1 Tax=Lysobacter sp. TAF61 TaxID=3233072 RepID=UPI003F9548A9